jgi:hypothetical protein
MSDGKICRKKRNFATVIRKLGTELNDDILDWGEKLLTVACTTFEELES